MSLLHVDMRQGMIFGAICWSLGLTVTSGMLGTCKMMTPVTLVGSPAARGSLIRVKWLLPMQCVRAMLLMLTVLQPAYGATPRPMSSHLQMHAA